MPDSDLHSTITDTNGIKMNHRRDSITTDFDPDHKSYSRHLESSRSSRKSAKDYKRDEIKSLAELSSTLSASSSLSGAIQRPLINEDDEDDDDNTNGEEDNDSTMTTFDYEVKSNPEFSFPSDGYRLSHVNRSSASLAVSCHGNSSVSELPPQKAPIDHLHYPAPVATNTHNSEYSSSASSLHNNSSNTSPSNMNGKHKNHSRFKHYHKPKVTESPRLVFLCQKFINERNTDGLALIARRRGLPPKLRQYAWPLLLESHPYVMNPSVVAEYPSQPLSGDRIPIKRIRKEIERYQKRLVMHSSKPKSSQSSTTNNSTTASTIPISSSRVNPTTAAENNNSNVNASNAGMNTNLNNDSINDTGDNITAASLEAQKIQAIEDALVAFLKKWGHITPYEPGMVYLAFSLADWVDPVCRMEDKYQLLRGTHQSASNTTESQASSPELSPADEHQSQSQQLPTAPSPSSSGSATPTPVDSYTPLTLRSLSFTLPYQFSTVFEHLLLIVFHTPKSEENGPRGPCDSFTADRISFFLSVMRRLLPDLSKHFDEEDILSSIGGDEWLLWWIKWIGAKVWDRKDRARIWDMYFGWRPIPASPEFDLPKAARANAKKRRDEYARTHPNAPKNEASDIFEEENERSICMDNMVLDLQELELELGPDPFWSASITGEDDKEHSNQPHDGDVTMDSNHFSSTATTIEPLLEHLFVCIVLLKSKALTLLELDQSEIRGCLGRLYRSNDIESIIVEAGECWRTWRHTEELENNDD